LCEQTAAHGLRRPGLGRVQPLRLRPTWASRDGASRARGDGGVGPITGQTKPSRKTAAMIIVADVHAATGRAIMGERWARCEARLTRTPSTRAITPRRETRSNETPAIRERRGRAVFADAPSWPGHALLEVRTGPKLPQRPPKLYWRAD